MIEQVIERKVAGYSSGAPAAREAQVGTEWADG
jgi:hypothetical protein